MAKEWELVETRIISGRGLFLYSLRPEDREVYISCNVLRRPVRDYPNKNYPREPSLYAYIEWEYQGYVQRTDAMRYLRQDFYWRQDEAGQLYFSLTCMYESLQGKLNNILALLGVPPGGIPVVIPTVPNQRYFDRILFECHLDTALEVQLWRLEYDRACPEAEPTPRRRPRNPPPPSVPPGTPLDEDNTPVSPPYDAGNDNGDTVPFEEDTDSQPPGDYPKGELCEEWTVVASWRWTAGADPLAGSFSVDVFAPIVDPPSLEVREVSGIARLFLSVRCAGIPLLGQSCGDIQEREIDISSSSAGVASLAESAIESVVPKA